MIDPVTLTLALNRLLFAALAVATIFLRILPMDHAAGDLPGPDILLCITLAWAMRRQDYVPIWLITAVFLAEDLILMRPPGLWCALVVLVTEFLRMRGVLMRELNFVVEWVVVSALMLLMMVIYRIIFAIAFLPQVSVGFALIQVLWSIIAYPIVVLVSQYILDFHKPGTGEIDAFGRRF